MTNSNSARSLKDDAKAKGAQQSPPNHDADRQARENENPDGDNDAPSKTWMGHYTDDMSKEDPEFDYAPVLLPWQIGLFLLTSTITQNLSYVMATYLSKNMYIAWTPAQQSQFYSLVYNMLYLGPVFGLAVDFVRIFRERFRPVIIIACIINAVIGFVCFATKQVPSQYGSCLILAWLMEVVVMFIYMPMNAVVINYGNRVVESPGETSSRIGGLMAQAMVWRTTGSLLYTFFREWGYGSTLEKVYVDNRWFCLIAAIFSLVLVVQVIFLTKRCYYTDYRKVSVKNSEQVRFYRNAINMSHEATADKTEAPGGKFMFILCFTFIYFMLPDPLYNTKFSFEYQYTSKFSVNLAHVNNVLGAIGAVLGALAYALWMYFAQRSECSHGRMYRANPFVIVLAGCCAWAFGIFFHFWGEMGSGNKSFNYKVFICFESIVVNGLLRFAFMPSLSLAAMQAPRFFETTAFQLFSVSTSGGGLVSSSVTTGFMSSLGVTATKGYWKALLLFIVFRFIPMVIAGSLPRFREDETIAIAKGPHEPATEMKSEPELRDTQPIEADDKRPRED